MVVAILGVGAIPAVSSSARGKDRQAAGKSALAIVLHREWRKESLALHASATTSGGIPATVRAELLEEALWVASKFKGSNPHDIQAVLTNGEHLRALGIGPRLYEGGEPTPAPINTRLYLIAMRGSFRYPHCKVQPGETVRCEPTPVLEVTVLVSTKRVFDSERSNSYPGLKGFGVPVCLRACKTPHSATAALQIEYLTRFGELHYIVKCDPASGTIADTEAACSEIARYPGMVRKGAYGSHDCPPGEPIIRVSGQYDRRPVNVLFSRCKYGDTYQGRWQHLLPTQQQENEVRIDLATGPFALGDTKSSVDARLARTPAGTAGGLYVYQPWGFSASCEGTAGSTANPILAMRYDSAGRLIAVIDDQDTLTLGGEEVSNLVGRCHGRQETELLSWSPVTCGGQEARADHPLNAGSTAHDTTIVVEGTERGQSPLVIVTSDPSSACEDVARLHAEWGA
jgi:hypothetical protein